MKRKIKELVPPGSDVKKTILLFGGEILMMIIISLIALSKILDANYFLFHDFFGYYYDEGYMMPYFGDAISKCMLFFWAVVLFNISFGAANYRSFSKESKSIYVMKRIPDAGEMLRRSFSLPLLGIAAAFVTAIIVLIIYYLIYRYLPPEDRIYPVYITDFLRAFI